LKRFKAPVALPRRDMSAGGCPFCCHEGLSLQTFHETEQCLCLYDIRPIVPGHSLILPKRHVGSFLSLGEAELMEMLLLAQRVLRALMKCYGAEGFDLALQEGECAGQSIRHLHLHLVPRRWGDLPDPGDWASAIEKGGVANRISDEEIAENVRRIRAALAEV